MILKNTRLTCRMCREAAKKGGKKMRTRISLLLIEIDPLCLPGQNVEEPHILVAFPEDNDDNLFQMLDNFDKLINNQPDLVLKPDPKLIELADNLVEGVEVN
jgi:hypothetical protein